MAAFLSDTLTGATALINGRVPAVGGGTWVTPGDTSLNVIMTGFMNSGGPYVWSQGLISQNSQTPFLVGYASLTPPTPDYAVTFVLRLDSSSDNSHGVMLRGNVVNGHGYYVRVTQTRTYIMKGVGGAVAEVATTGSNQATFGVPPTATEVTFVAQIKDKTITVLRNGSVILSWTDTGTSIDSAGKIGLVPCGGTGAFVMRRISAEDVSATISAGDMAGAGATGGTMAGRAQTAASFDAAGTVPVSNIVSSQPRVAVMASAGVTTPNIFGLRLDVAQMYSLSEPDVPNMVSITFQYRVGVMGGAGATTGSLVGQADTVAGFAGAAASVAAMASNSLLKDMAFFGYGSGGSAVGLFRGVAVGAGKMGFPSEPTQKAEFTGRSTAVTVFRAAGFADTAILQGYQPFSITGAGSSTASFIPHDVVIPATFAVEGKSEAGLAPPIIVPLIMTSAGFGSGVMVSSTIRLAEMSGGGRSTISLWAGSGILPSIFDSVSLVSGKMISLSFSTLIPTPDDRCVYLDTDDREVLLDAEDREVLLEEDERITILPAEDRIAYA